MRFVKGDFGNELYDSWFPLVKGHELNVRKMIYEMEIAYETLKKGLDPFEEASEIHFSLNCEDKNTRLDKRSY